MEYHSQVGPEQVSLMDTLVKKVAGSSNEPRNDAHQILHLTNEVMLVYASDGDLNIQVFDSEVTLKKNEVLFLNKNVLYLIDSQPDTTYYEISLPKKIISFWPDSYMEINDVLPIITDQRLTHFVISPEQNIDDQIIRDCNTLINLFYSNVSSNKIYSLAVGTVSIYCKLLSIMPDVSDIPLNNDRTKAIQVISFIQKEFSKPLTQTQLSQIVGTRIAVLDQIFNKYVHCSPIKYLIRYRLYQSTVLLKQTNQKVQEISKNVGFNAPSSFILQFKKEFGRTPKDYRAQYLKDSPKK